MTTPKVGTIQRGGARFYVHPETKAKAIGVTSAVNMLPKPFLQFWAAKSVAEFAVKNAGTLVQMVLDRDHDPVAAVDWLKNAPRRDTGKAADMGTAVHDLVERIARGEDVGPIHPDYQGFVKGFREFLDRHQPEFLLMEETVWSEAHGYAGTFDAIARIHGETVVLDYKTTRSGVHAEVALQMAAYRYADYIIRADGGRVPIPTLDGAAVLHLRPEEWSLVPVRADEEVHEAFLHLLATVNWERELSKKVLGRPL